MKKVITFSAICIITSILFSSCNSNLSITKRHYNSGYYIAYDNNKQVTPVPKEEEKVMQTQTNDPLYSLKTQSDQNTLGGYSSAPPKSDINDLVASNEEIQQKLIPKKRIKNALKQKTKIIEYPASPIRHSLFKLRKRNDQDVVVADGLSLFWLVILVVLILWALGFLIGGFGGLLNLLLVLALILLILWLFRVI